MIADGRLAERLVGIDLGQLETLVIVGEQFSEIAGGKLTLTYSAHTCGWLPR